MEITFLCKFSYDTEFKLYTWHFAFLKPSDLLIFKTYEASANLPSLSSPFLEKYLQGKTCFSDLDRKYMQGAEWSQVCPYHIWICLKLHFNLLPAKLPTSPLPK